VRSGIRVSVVPIPAYRFAHAGYSLARSGGRVLTFKLRHALQAECLPTFESIVGLLKRFPMNVIDVSQLFRRKTVQVVEAIKSERYETGLANKQVSHNRETPSAWEMLAANLLRDVRAGFHEIDPSVGFAHHDTHCVPNSLGAA
jgi:hypothetical protein